MATDHSLTDFIRNILFANKLKLSIKDKAFIARLNAGMASITHLYYQIYSSHPKKDEIFGQLIATLVRAYQSREKDLRKRDEEKAKKGNWFLSNELVGMSLYVDRFAGDLPKLKTKLPYLEELGVNFLHLMPLFKSPAGESDGGYAVSDFRNVDKKFGSLEDLIALRKEMQQKGMYMMLDIVLNHTSHRHEWAEKAKAGDPYYQDFFYMFDNRWIPNQYEEKMPEVFPEAAPGNFTYVEECQKWVMTVFHNYQWDLNYMNPMVFRAMLDNVLFYANLGVDVLRIDAPAFIWKQTWTTSQNLPQVHILLQLIKECVLVAAPGMAILGEAIVAPNEIIKYFGTGDYTARECDFAYNATHMALQWDMLATGETDVMLAAQHAILQKPFGTSWISYIRCHDDIGMGYEDYMIEMTGKSPYRHRRYLMDYYSGNLAGSSAYGEMFSFNPKTGDARISGTLASLCGLEKAIDEGDLNEIDLSIQKIIMMQAHFMFLGGLPMLYYGDEIGYTNDYSFSDDPGKSYDNRWMHRPLIDWEKAERRLEAGTVENRIFTQMQALIKIRKNLSVIGDYKNLTWISPHNIHIAAFLRSFEGKSFYGVFNFSDKYQNLTWYAFREKEESPESLFDHWSQKEIKVGPDHEYLWLEPYQFCLLEPIQLV